MKRHCYLRTFGTAVVLLSTLGLGVVHAQAPAGARSEQADPDALLAEASATLSDFMQDPAMEWFRENVGSARALLVVPQYVKIGLFVAGASGPGVLVGRDADSGWRGPVFYKLNTASLGLQAGVERSEMVVLARTQSGLESLLTSSVKFGGKISAAAGPVGGSAITETEDIVYFVRKASGGFLGMSLDGVVIEPERELMTAYYGREATPMDVLVRGSVTSPKPNPMLAILQ